MPLSYLQIEHCKEKDLQLGYSVEWVEWYYLLHLQISKTTVELYYVTFNYRLKKQVVNRRFICVTYSVNNPVLAFIGNNYN